jgi:predicted ATPase
MAGETAAEDVRKGRTFAALSRLVGLLSAGRSAVMVFNDIHWSDELTRDWLSLLCENGIDGVMLLATMRPEEAASPKEIKTIPLKPLGVDDVRELISHVAGGKVLPKEVSVQITRRTRGVALYVVELTRALLASGMMSSGRERNGGRSRWMTLRR